MPFAAALTPARLRGRVLRAALAASLVVGVAAALPSSAEEGVYTDDRGRLAVAAFTSPSEFSFGASCPAVPVEQGVSVWMYALPAHAAVPGARVTVTSASPVITPYLSASVFTSECRHTRRVSAATGQFGIDTVLAAGEKYLLVTASYGAQISLRLKVTGEGVSQTAPPAAPSPAPTQEPDAPFDGVAMARGDYSGGVNDPLFRERSTAAASFELQGQWGMRKIRALEAWKEQKATGAGVRVAILDTGLDVDHPDFACAGKVARLDAARFPRFADVTDVDGHGTHVAGIVGACTNNGEGVVGTAPDATILPVQALSPTEATAERLGAAIRAAVDSGAHVINMSLGFGAHSSIGTAASEAGIFARTVDPAIEHAVSRGVVVVAAAGNSTFPVCGYPALAEDVVCVGSTDRRDLNAWYSNFPVTPYGAAVVAPGGSGTLGLACNGGGEGVLSTYSRAAEFQCPTYPGYSTLDGTSMASPHVAGVAALVYDRLGAQRSPEAGAKVVQALVDGAVDLYTPGYDPMSGEGRVDALGAVRAVTPVTDGSTTSPAPTETATPAPTPTADAERATTLELVAPDTGQTTDALPLAARVTDDAGDAVAGAPVAFRLSGAGGTREVTATTGADGVAATSLPLDLAPGSYRLDGAYAGEPGSRTGSADDQPVEVVRDDSTTTLAVDGNGSKRTLTVRLADQDTASSGLGGRTVVLLADGEQIGSVVTDDNGSATYAPAGKARGARTYEARFAGDDRYTGSSATASS